MGDSISLLLMALLSLQSGPSNADGETSAAKKANAPCVVTAPAKQRADRNAACKQTAERTTRVRMTIPPAKRDRQTAVAAVR